MGSMENKKINLVGLILVCVILFGGDAKGNNNITMVGFAGLANQNTNPVNLKQEDGAIEGYNPGSPDLDATAMGLPPPYPPGATRLVSVIPGHLLSTDTRDIDSMTDYIVQAETIGVNIGEDNYWHFSISEDTGDSFYWKNIFAERYGTDDINDPNNVKAIVDVKYISDNDVDSIGQGWVISGTVPVTEGIFDQFRIKFYNHADLNRDTKVNLKDWAFLAANYGRSGIDKGSNPTDPNDYADIDGNGSVGLEDVTTFSGSWLWQVDYL